MDEAYAIPESVSIDYDHINAEHGRLVDILNAILRAMRGGQVLVGDTLDEHLIALSGAMRDHFEHEEQEMASLGYGDLARHKVHHATCAAELETLCDAISARNVVTKDDLDRIFDMIVEDVIRADSGFKSFLYEKGLIL